MTQVNNLLRLDYAELRIVFTTVSIYDLAFANLLLFYYEDGEITGW